MAYAYVVEIRCILPENVHVIILTATVTKATLVFIISSLGKVNPICVMPHKMNVTHRVVGRSPSKICESHCVQMQGKAAAQLYPKTIFVGGVYTLCSVYTYSLETRMDYLTPSVVMTTTL